MTWLRLPTSREISNFVTLVATVQCNFCQISMLEAFQARPSLTHNKTQAVLMNQVLRQLATKKRWPGEVMGMQKRPGPVGRPPDPFSSRPELRGAEHAPLLPTEVDGMGHWKDHVPLRTGGRRLPCLLQEGCILFRS